MKLVSTAQPDDRWKKVLGFLVLMLLVNIFREH
jgi:hypothetical protein